MSVDVFIGVPVDVFVGVSVGELQYDTQVSTYSTYIRCLVRHAVHHLYMYVWSYQVYLCDREIEGRCPYAHMYNPTLQLVGFIL